MRRALVSPPRQWRARANLAGADQSEVSATTPTACGFISLERAGSRARFALGPRIGPPPSSSFLGFLLTAERALLLACPTTYILPVSKLTR